MEKTEEMNNKKHYDSGLVFIIFQFLSVLAVLCFVLCAKYIGGDFYSIVKKWYADNICEKTSVDLVIGDEGFVSSMTDINSFCIPAAGNVTSEFGFRNHPISGSYSLHKGIDIGGEAGEHILCVIDGTVSETGYGKSYGNYVVVKHSSDVSTLYAHCDKILAKEGEKVFKGETIALMGDTGNTTGPHLHFEICVNGEPIDPLWIIGKI